jgi:hypothetical protein
MDSNNASRASFTPTASGESTATASDLMSEAEETTRTATRQGSEGCPPNGGASCPVNEPPNNSIGTITTSDSTRRNEAREEMMKVYRLYSAKQLPDRVTEVTRDVKLAVRSKIFRQVKFVINEGGSRCARKELESKMLNNIGKSHCRQDFTRPSSYAYQVALALNKNLSGKDVNYTELAKWWIVYQGVVTSEIRQCRSTINGKIRRSFFEGKQS